MTYSYDRTASGHDSYDKRLEQLQASFTGEVGEAFYGYIQHLHNRLSKREPYASITSFLSWDYGDPRQVSQGVWTIRVYQKSASTYPGDLDPNVLITLTFEADGGVDVEAKAGSKKLLSSNVKGSSRGIALAVGEVWERELTGDVDYGRFASSKVAAYMHFADAIPSPADQLRKMESHPPRIRERGEFYVVELFSPITNEYTPQGGHRNEEVAQKDLNNWLEAHKESIRRLKSQKNASYLYGKG